MNERLIVKNFLCLKDIDIEVKDFLVLIGPQAAGKSLCAKLLYFLRTISEEVSIYNMPRLWTESYSLDKILIDKFEAFFPKPYWVEQDFYIEYQRNQNKSFVIKKRGSENLQFHLYPNIQVFADPDAIQPVMEFIKYNNNPEKMREFLNLISNKHYKTTVPRNIFIPAGRSFFSLLQKNIYRFLQTSNSIDPFLLEFGIFYEDIKQTVRNIPAEAQALIHAILKGDYVPNEDMVRLTDGRKISPELLSSGQQEALPLALVFAHIISLRLEPYYDFTNIYVEEPEAHLFPDAQEQVSRLISFLQYNAKHEVTFVITTHSPYILAAFNNLIKADNIVKQNPGIKEAVCGKIPEAMHIDIERSSAYSLKDGRAMNIIDGETNLISADAIDGVSENIMETFNALQEIEFEGGGAGNNV